MHMNIVKNLNLLVNQTGLLWGKIILIRVPTQKLPQLFNRRGTVKIYFHTKCYQNC